ncbi:MAG: hypothetical protein KBD78_11450, partial [Oligoflexales bacterium]|nr:hypothetical protein [Oligoflexales bacterium]
IGNRKTYAKRDANMHPELTKMIEVSPSELEKYESTGAILAINVADLMPQVWYDVFAICGHVTKKTGLTGAALSEKLKKVFRLDFSYGEAFDVALIKAKLERIRYLLSKPVGHFAYIQFAEFREEAGKISKGDEKYYLSANDLTKISGPIFKLLIMDVYTLFDMANSLGIFNANPQTAATNFSTFVSDLNTNWLLRNIGIAYSSEKKFYDRNNEGVLYPWRLSNQNQFFGLSNWSWDKDQLRFFNRENNMGVLPPTVLRVDLMRSALEQLKELTL